MAMSPQIYGFNLAQSIAVSRAILIGLKMNASLDSLSYQRLEEAPGGTGLSIYQWFNRATELSSSY